MGGFLWQEAVFSFFVGWNMYPVTQKMLCRDDSCQDVHSHKWKMLHCDRARTRRLSFANKPQNHAGSE